MTREQETNARLAAAYVTALSFVLWAIIGAIVWGIVG